MIVRKKAVVWRKSAAGRTRFYWPARVVAIRERMSLSQRGFAKLIGMSVDTLQNLKPRGCWSAQDLVDTPFLSSVCCGLEANGAHSVQVAMATKRIVERFDVVGDIGQCVFASLVDLLPYPLFL